MPSFSKIACFETANSLLSDKLGDFRDLVKDNKIQQAISACAELAFGKSYKFFALGYEGLCRSGLDARQQYHSKPSVSDKNCPNGIGIKNRIEVYTFGKFTLASISFWEFQTYFIAYSFIERHDLLYGFYYYTREIAKNSGFELNTALQANSKVSLGELCFSVFERSGKYQTRLKSLRGVSCKVPLRILY